VIVFFLLAALLVVAVLVLLLPAAGRFQNSVDRREINISIARAQLAELVQKQQDGELAETEFQLERERLERELAGDLAQREAQLQDNSGRWIVWPLAALIPVMAGVVYMIVGTPAAIDPANRQAVAQPPAQTAQQTPDMRDVVVRIKERLEQQPDDATGWFMLGRAHMALAEYSEAVVAIRRANELTGDNPEIMVRLADAIAMSQGGSMAGEPEPLLVKALEMQPGNLQGLWLLGIAQNERADYAGAVGTWQKLLPLLSEDPQSAREIQSLINGAQDALVQSGGEVNAATDTNTAAPAAETSGAALTVDVSVAADVADGLGADTVVFVYAKAASGPPMPLAVARKTLGELPFTVVLSDEDAMMPAMKLSAFDQVVVGARISRSGNAIAESGDIFAESGSISNTQQQPVVIEIKETVQ
jgi:cytochrome c-type biogenesis protein CcmH